MTDIIASDKVVSLAYTLTVDGEVISEFDVNDPLEYLHGAENIIPGLERVLEGKRVGDRFSVTVPPEDAYGDYEEDDIDEIPRSEIPAIETLEEGSMVEVEDEDGYSFYATVTRITADTVVLDFNPPLAGKTLTYDVEVLGIRPATEEELEHGHVHGDDYDEDYDDYEDDEDYDDEE